MLRPPAGGPARFRVSYEDAEVCYPVLVTARYDLYGGPGFDHGDSDRLSLSWSIDHSASAVEWRRSCGTRIEIPPYGLWRRVDDALFDALACWPPSEAAGPEPSRVPLLGRLVERRVVAAAAACRRGTGRKEYAGRKRASAVPRAAGEPAIVVAVRGCAESQSPAPLLPRSGRSGPVGISCRPALRSPALSMRYRICVAVMVRRSCSRIESEAR